MTKGTWQDKGVVTEHRGVEISVKLGHRASGEIDAFYLMNFKRHEFDCPLQTAGMGWQTEEMAQNACIEAARKEIDRRLDLLKLKQRKLSKRRLKQRSMTQK